MPPHEKRERRTIAFFFLRNRGGRSSTPKEKKKRRRKRPTFPFPQTEKRKLSWLSKGGKEDDCDLKSEKERGCSDTQKKWENRCCCCLSQFSAVVRREAKKERDFFWVRRRQRKMPFAKEDFGRWKLSIDRQTLERPRLKSARLFFVLFFGEISDWRLWFLNPPLRWRFFPRNSEGGKAFPRKISDDWRTDTHAYDRPNFFANACRDGRNFARIYFF